jgi:hypothetical protein
MRHEEPSPRDLGDLTVEELEQQGAVELPDRESLSLIKPHPAIPTVPSALPDALAEPYGPGDDRPDIVRPPPEG